MAARSLRTCLYSVCERAKHSKIAIFAWTSYKKAIGNQMEAHNGGRIFPIDAYTVYVSVQSTLRSPFLYGLRMRKFQVTIYRPKMASRPFRTCLYSVRERTKHSNIAIFVLTSYKKAIGNQLEAQNGGRIFPVHAYTVYVSVQNTLKSPFLYGLRMRKFQVIIWRPKMAVEFFPYMPIQCT